MNAQFTLVDSTGQSWDLSATWDGPASIWELLGAAGTPGTPLPYPGASVWVDGRAVTADADLARTGLRPGSVVSLRPDVADSSRPVDVASGPHLAVVGGPDAGSTEPLTAGRLTVGRALRASLRIDDPSVGREHLSVDVPRDGGDPTVEPLGHYATIDGDRLDGPTPWPSGVPLTIGDSVVEWRPGRSGDAVVRGGADGRLELRRPPRLATAKEPSPSIEWPAGPTSPPGKSLPLVTAVAPLALGAVLFAVTGSALMLLLVLMSPVMAVASTVTDRRSGRRRPQRDRAGFEQRSGAGELALRAALVDEQRRPRAAGPDPATVSAVALGPTRQLWERRRRDHDFLVLRVGLADQRSSIRLTRTGLGPTQTLDTPTAPAVPVTVDLAGTGVLGVVGPASWSGPLTTWLVAQAAVQSGPADLRLAVLAPEGAEGARRWRWTRWLPHVVPGDWTVDSLERRVTALAQLVERRRQEAGADPRRWPTVLVVADPAHDVRRLPGMELMLREGPAVGVVAICVGQQERFLPPECRAVICGGDAGAVLSRPGEADITAIRADGVGGSWAARVARALAPLSDPEALGAAGAVAKADRLLDLLEVDPHDDPGTVVDR